jgi:hypothetical protein
MRGGEGARRRRARTRPAPGRVSGRIGGGRIVVGCITRQGQRDAVDPQRVHRSDLRIRHSQVTALVAAALALFTPAECRNYPRDSGYRLTVQS